MTIKTTILTFFSGLILFILSCDYSRTKEINKLKIITLNKQDSIIDSESRQLFSRLDSALTRDSSQRIILRLFYDYSMVVFKRTKEITNTINITISKYDSLATFDSQYALLDAIFIVEKFRTYQSTICTYSRDDHQETLDTIVQVTDIKSTYQTLMNPHQNKTKENFIYNLSQLKVAARQTQKIMIERILANWDSKPAIIIIESDTNGHTDTIHWAKEDYK